MEYTINPVLSEDALFRSRWGKRITGAGKSLPTLFLPSFCIRDNLLMIESALATAGFFVYTVFIDFFQQFKLKYRIDIRTLIPKKARRDVLFGCVLRAENRWEEYGS